jgi:hypothetical protein
MEASRSGRQFFDVGKHITVEQIVALAIVRLSSQSHDWPNRRRPMDGPART